MTECLPTPQAVRAEFRRLFAIDPDQALNYLHDLGITSGSIQSGAQTPAICWTSESPYGTLECTINLSKPEKDPRAIAAATSKSHAASAPPAMPQVPQCDLCWENEGFPGSAEHPAKPGLRIAAIELGGERWGLQYSPYAYFTEHCVVLSERHRPMKIDAACFERLIDFVDAFPSYFIGSNADLPIVGGSILTHDHFQGGRHTFPLMSAPLERVFTLASSPGVRCGMVKWPASVVRLASTDRSTLTQAAMQILSGWQRFSHKACNIVAASAHTPHNTLNPIVHKSESTYTMDLVLRNNRTTKVHPWGIFHPGEELHHIKKENIGLIEVMGLAILPPRLARELPLVQHELIQAAHQELSPQTVEDRLRYAPATKAHATWAAAIYARHADELVTFETDPACLHPLILQEVAHVFVAILETAGVFKRNATGEAGWNAFLKELNATTGA